MYADYANKIQNNKLNKKQKTKANEHVHTEPAQRQKMRIKMKTIEKAVGIMYWPQHCFNARFSCRIWGPENCNIAFGTTPTIIL